MLAVVVVSFAQQPAGWLVDEGSAKAELSEARRPPLSAGVEVSVMVVPAVIRPWHAPLPS